MGYVKPNTVKGVYIMRCTLLTEKPMKCVTFGEETDVMQVAIEKKALPNSVGQIQTDGTKINLIRY